MSVASPAQRQTPGGGSSSEPKIQHSFDGDVKVLNSTFDCRMEIRKTLGNLQQLLQRLEGRNVQVAAEIKLRIAGPDPKEHVYSVTIHDPTLDVSTFEKQFPSASKKDAPAHTNGSSGKRKSRDGGDDDDDDVIEVQPFKRARTTAEDGTIFTSSNRDTDGLLKDILSILKQRSSSDPLDFMKKWHGEWVKQGGWLFDTVNKAEKLANDNHASVYTRMGNVQDVLGQSMNAASASTMAELNNISKLIPWLEACRKSAADKAQAREEKWRTSSATFHDQSRRERETAEERMEAELAKQRVLLEKIARASGVEMKEEPEETPGRDQEERQMSLGAQLRDELAEYGSRVAGERNAVAVVGEVEGGPATGAGHEKRKETISIDDDD
ncbi:hypothetical protein LTR10_003142 [Elasticomyces elasticus]|nr:hypothetical protein LTR10_003142 [Elasticomyces elasticus]KAK4969414.1 hypothetical protein LTR42_008684 [Elasticomyces elasticus]